MSRIIPALADSATRVLPNPAAASGGAAGLTWIPLALNSFDKSSDPSAILTGAVSDGGGGAITWPMKAADEQFMDLRVAALHTMPIATLAGIVGVTEASIMDGSNVILVQMKVSAIEAKVQVFAGFGDREADAQGAIDGFGSGLLSTNGTTVTFAYLNGGTKGTPGGGNSDMALVHTLTDFQLYDDATVNYIGASGAHFDSNNASGRFAQGRYAASTSSGLDLVTTFLIGTIFLNNSGGTAGNCTCTFNVAVQSAIERFGIPA